MSRRHEDRAEDDRRRSTCRGPGPVRAAGPCRARPSARSRARPAAATASRTRSTARGPSRRTVAPARATATSAARGARRRGSPRRRPAGAASAGRSRGSGSRSSGSRGSTTGAARPFTASETSLTTGERSATNRCRNAASSDSKNRLIGLNSRTPRNVRPKYADSASQKRPLAPSVCGRAGGSPDGRRCRRPVLDAPAASSGRRSGRGLGRVHGATLARTPSGRAATHAAATSAIDRPSLDLGVHPPEIGRVSGDVTARAPSATPVPNRWSTSGRITGTTCSAGCRWRSSRSSTRSPLSSAALEVNSSPRRRTPAAAPAP